MGSGSGGDGVEGCTGSKKTGLGTEQPCYIINISGGVANFTMGGY